ncbi:MAG: KEOPS complex kinase/ATPase Bud32 [Methanopyri archaeon]|jgi:TP53 regulating kinase-like protein|nr:KEOPS complex kinase/ATPase Bud32 [Methanopyri archaeon]
MNDERQEIARGAEAVLYRAPGEDGDVLIKERVPKSYRHHILDDRLRRRRTKREAKLLEKARTVGVTCPKVLAVDKRAQAIVMEFIDGPPLRQAANEVGPKERYRLFTELGKMVGSLHEKDMMHGDLTTSNVIVKDGNLHLIDFGLGFHSTNVEDKAVDLHLLERAIDATHFAFADEAFDAVKKGYVETVPDAEQVFRRIEQIEGRRRYSSKGS